MRLQKNGLALIITLCILLQVCVLVDGLYQLEVTVFGYNNPTGRCQDCPLHDDTRACCDRFQTTECEGSDLCDSFFVYCLRTIGSTGRGCSYFGNQTSNFNRNDDGSINFSQNTVLGLENPIILQGLTDIYMGVQLHIEVVDDDSDRRITSPDNVDELIDVLLIDHNLPIGQTLSRQTHDGIYDYVMMDLSIIARCVRNFQGPDCSRCLPGFAGIMCNVRINECNCSGHGQCFDGMPSLTCNCDPDFTGVECEVNIDDCMGVNCSENGQCVDGVLSYTCDCDPGFTGMKCDVDIDDCIGMNCSGNGQCVDGINSFSCNCNASFTGPLCESTQINASDSEGSATAILIGGILGAVILSTLLLALLIVVVICSTLYKKHKVCYQAKKEHGVVSHGQSGAANTAHHGRPNVSVRYTKPSSHQAQDTEEAVTRIFDNPIYGTDNDKVNGGVKTDQSRLLSISLPDHEFDNPIYATKETENDYSMITGTSAHKDETNSELQTTYESIHDGQLPSSYRPLINGVLEKYS